MVKCGIKKLQLSDNNGDDTVDVMTVVQASQLRLVDVSTGRETASFPSSSTKPDAARPSSASSSSSSSVRPSDDDPPPLQEPHGVCADQRGLVFVADRRAHAVRVFHETRGAVQTTAAEVPTTRRLDGLWPRLAGVQTTAGNSSSTSVRSIASYDDERHRVGLPYAVACNQRGQLAVAEYVGTVRVYNYFDDTDSDC